MTSPITNAVPYTMTDATANTGARLGPRRGRANAAPDRRVPQGARRRPHVPTKIDCLIEVANKLREARTIGEACSDRALIYFIDMTIGHVCDSLDDRRRARQAPLILAGAPF